jgi:hypothetical protein
MIKTNTAIAFAKAFALMLVASSAHANLVQNGSFELTTNGAAPIGEWGVTQATGWTATGPGFMTLYAPGTADTTGSKATNFGQTMTLWGSHNGGAGVIPDSSPDGGNFLATDTTYGYQNKDVTPLLSQTINGLKVGEQYTLSFNYAAAEWSPYTSPGNLTNAWKVSFGGQVQDTPTLTYPNKGFTGWQQASFTYTATSSSQVLGFLATNAPSGVPPIALLDGISLTPVTPPVPEPEEWAMMLVGAGLVGYQVRRKQAKVAA